MQKIKICKRQNWEKKTKNFYNRRHRKIKNYWWKIGKINYVINCKDYFTIIFRYNVNEDELINYKKLILVLSNNLLKEYDIKIKSKTNEMNNWYDCYYNLKILLIVDKYLSDREFDYMIGEFNEEKIIIILNT